VRRSLVFFGLLVLACAKPLPDGAVHTVVQRSHEGKRVIFIGLDGGDWQLLEPFMRDGTMPHLRAIVEHAETRVLLTQHPPLSPLVWTSMMTGVSPLEHRILDFTRVSPATNTQEPITADERAVPALWNIARAGGKRVAVFGMWATWPEEPGIVLSHRDLPRDFRAATEIVHRRAMQTIRSEKPDLSVVYIQGTDEIGHVTSGDVTAARAYFRRVDAILGEYEVLARELDAELVIASDHGFDWGGRHEESSTATATAAKWHRAEGIWIRWPRQPERLEPARVAQVCATLIDILGLPQGDGLARAIGEIRSTQSVNYRRFFQRVAAVSSSDENEEIAKLRSLGYLSPAGSSSGSTRTPQSHNNEGLLLREAGEIDAAEKAFVAALALQPDYASARTNLDDLLRSRAVVRLKARDCRGAVADFRAVSKQTADVWTGIAAAEGCLGNETAAAEAFERAAALDPKLRYSAGTLFK
jgi:tetratricopeptide (TPR) repeat protein